MNRSRWWMVFLELVIVLMPWGEGARSSSPRPYNLEEMVEMADRIFLGTAVEESSGRDDRGLPARVTTFEISRPLKGALGDRIRVKMIGTTGLLPPDPPRWVPGVPRFRMREEYLVFLMPVTILGFTSPVGALQGAFAVTSDGKGGKVVVNEVDNANLLFGLDRHDRSRLGLTSERQPLVSRGRGPLGLEVMLGAIERVLSERGKEPAPGPDAGRPEPKDSTPEDSTQEPESSSPDEGAGDVEPEGGSSPARGSPSEEGPPGKERALEEGPGDAREAAVEAGEQLVDLG